MPKETAFEERRLHWSPFIKELVGIETGATVGVTEYVRAFNSLRPEHRIKGERRFEVRPEDRRAIYQQAEGKRAPQAVNAWWHGQALATWYPWASGLLGLYAAGHLADFVGTLSSLEPTEGRDHAVMLSALINTAYAATYANKLEISIEGARMLHDRGVRLTPSADEELDRLKCREEARSVWATLRNSELGPLLGKAWERWSQPKQPKLSRFCGEAHRIALDRSFTFVERVQLVTRALTSWLHTSITPEPPEFLFVTDGYIDQILNLNTAAARQARLAFFMYWCHAQTIGDEDWFPDIKGATDGIAGRDPGTTLREYLSKIGQAR